MMRFLLKIILFMMLINLAVAEQPSHKKQAKNLRHTKTKVAPHTHKKAKPRQVRVYHPQVAAPSEAKLNMAMPAAHPETGFFKGFFSHPVASVEDRVVKFVRNTVSNLRYSKYKMGGGHFEPSRGVYVLDCSDYVDNILHRADPVAYSNLVNFTGSDRPTSQHYYEFFTELNEDNLQHGWSKIQDVSELQAGDILVFRYKRNARSTGGHVMIVMGKPIGDNDVYLVRVADSAPSGHSHDTRQPNTSGIGIGTLLLKADAVTGRPLTFAWKVGAPWKSNVKIAMGRPVTSDKIAL